jgi:hypothetical protein
MNSLMAAWVAEIVLIAYRSSKQSAALAAKPIPGLALPSEYAASFVIFGALSFIPAGGQRTAGLIGWGLVLATAFNLWDPLTTGNPGGPAVKGGPSTKAPGSGVVLSPMLAKPQT